MYESRFERRKKHKVFIIRFLRFCHEVFVPTLPFVCVIIRARKLLRSYLGNKSPEIGK